MRRMTRWKTSVRDRGVLTAKENLKFEEAAIITKFQLT